jgi:hypothetical protein
MASSFVITTVERTAVANLVNTDLTNGYLKLYSGASPGPNSAATGTLLATFTLPAAASNDVTAGVITMAAIASVAASSTGVAGYGRFLKSDNTTVVGDADVDTADASIILDNTSINTGQLITLTTVVFTVGAGS